MAQTTNKIYIVRRKALLSSLLAALPLSALVGCSGAATRPPELSLSPDLTRNGGRVFAGTTIGFAGTIENKPTAPRYIVEKPLNEPVFDATKPVAWDNLKRGRIDFVSGFYDAPARLASDPTRVHYTDANQNGFLDVSEDNVVPNGNLDPGEDANGNGTLDRGETSADRTDPQAAPLREIVSVISTETYNSLRTRVDVIYDRYAELFKGAATFDQALTEARQLEGGKLLYPLQVLRDIWMAARPDLLPALNRMTTEEAKVVSLQRYVASLPSRQKSSVAFNVLHRVVADPVQADVSIRGAVRLSDYVTVPGDQEQYGSSGAVRPLSEVAKSATSDGIPSQRVKWEIENRANGAGGNIDQDGNYSAPNTLPRDDKGNLVTTGRHVQDVIVATSAADSRQTTRITVTVVTGDAPSEVKVN